MGVVDLTGVFRFALQMRIQCLGCGDVKYRVDIQVIISISERLKPYLPLIPPLSFNTDVHWFECLF